VLCPVRFRLQLHQHRWAVPAGEAVVGEARLCVWQGDGVGGAQHPAGWLPLAAVDVLAAAVWSRTVSRAHSRCGASLCWASCGQYTTSCCRSVEHAGCWGGGWLLGAGVEALGIARRWCTASCRGGVLVLAAGLWAATWHLLPALGTSEWVLPYIVGGCLGTRVMQQPQWLSSLVQQAWCVRSTLCAHALQQSRCCSCPAHSCGRAGYFPLLGASRSCVPVRGVRYGGNWKRLDSCLKVHAAVRQSVACYPT